MVQLGVDNDGPKQKSWVEDSFKNKFAEKLGKLVSKPKASSQPTADQAPKRGYWAQQRDTVKPRGNSNSNSVPKSGSANINSWLAYMRGETSHPSESAPGRNLGMPKPEPKSDIEMLIAELLNKSKSGPSWDTRAEDEDMINQIFGSQLAQIANARNSTNTRFNESLANTRDLYAGHEQEVRGAGRANLQKIATDLTNATNSTYDGAVGQVQEMQNANRSRGEEMLTRLGLQASAPLVNETADANQNAINDLVSAKAAQQNQNNSYAAADMRQNDARAASIASESVSKQADLSRQLQDILGELGNKEADINSAKAQAMYEASQNAKQNWRSDREYATSALSELLAAQQKAQGESSGGINGSQTASVLNGLGITDPRLQQQYSSAYTDAVMNAPFTPGVQDQTAAYLKYLVNNYEDLDPNLLLGLTQGNLNFGTYKPGQPVG